ncbi:MAG: hypothetical protein K8S99_11215 [Planctomycetes bacterium]|nr:hypothetical protein [Planctomycetota bacterium]
MMMSHPYSSGSPDPFDDLGPISPGPARFNLLLTQDRSHGGEHWTEQLPRLLGPQRIHAFVARTADEALAVAEEVDIHAALIDLATPPGTSRRIRGRSEGLWLLELFRRLPQCPPVVVIQNSAQERRMLDRAMHDALRLGAFSVLRKPVEIEQILTVLSCLIDRTYHGHWPGSPQ